MDEGRQRGSWANAFSTVMLSNAFFFPFKGIRYFYQNSEFWPPLLAVCVPAAILLIAIFTSLGVFVFPIYAFLVTTITGPFGLVSAVLLWFLLSRQLTITALELLFVRQIQARIFLLTLRNEGAEEVVGKYLLTMSRLRPKKTLRDRIYFQAFPSIARELLYVLLGIIPLAGPFTVMLFRAPIRGYKAHKPYYKLSMWNYSQVNHFYREYRRDYTAFGVVALLLEMVPGLTVFFTFTNNIGMALWTARYHTDFEAFMVEHNETEAEMAQDEEFWKTALGDKKLEEDYSEKQKKV